MSNLKARHILAWSAIVQVMWLSVWNLMALVVEGAAMSHTAKIYIYASILLFTMGLVWVASNGGTDDEPAVTLHDLL